MSIRSNTYDTVQWMDLHRGEQWSCSIRSKWFLLGLTWTQLLVLVLHQLVRCGGGDLVYVQARTDDAIGDAYAGGTMKTCRFEVSLLPT
jgi:hypothetical protein